MIKNRKELLKVSSPILRKRRRMLLDIAEYTLSNLSPAALLKNKISETSKFRRIAVFGIGKAAAGMADAVCSQLPRPAFKVLLANQGHPLPTAATLRNTNKIITCAKKLGPGDLAIVCISGGGSAMFELPLTGISLPELININRALIRSGAEIHEINTVRKHLSQVKGGRFAKLLAGTTVRTFVISDVVDNDLSTIASGPMSPDHTKHIDALNILKKYNIVLSERAMRILKNSSETPKPADGRWQDIEIVGDRNTAISFAARRAKMLRIPYRITEEPLAGEARLAGQNFLRRSRGLTIAAGETTVTCTGSGSGGRNQEFVLSALQKIRPNQTILALGTDGVDGICPTPVGGAIGDSEIAKGAEKKGLSIPKFLKNNDSYNFFKKAGGHIKTGPTGTNVGDLVLLFSSFA